MNKLKVLAEIKNKLKACGFDNPTFYFQCYTDKMFTFGLDMDGFIEITFICDEFETLLNDMKLNDLLNLKGIEYFEVNSEDYDIQETYNSLDEINQN